MLILAYVLISSHAWASAYNKWVILGLEIFCVNSWLTVLGVISTLASAIWSNLVYFMGDLPGFSYFYDAVVAAAALAGLEVALFLITLIVFGVFLHRHRKPNG